MPLEVFYKKAFHKNFTIFTKKTPVLKSLLNKVTGHKEEHLHTAASEVTLGNDCLGLSFLRVAFKTILSNITKIPVAFKPKPSGYHRKSKYLQSLDFLLD